MHELLNILHRQWGDPNMFRRVVVAFETLYVREMRALKTIEKGQMYFNEVSVASLPKHFVTNLIDDAIS